MPISLSGGPELSHLGIAKVRKALKQPEMSEQVFLPREGT